MKLFIDPRLTLPYGTERELKALSRPIDFPYEVCTGSQQLGWTYHFLGSKRGALAVSDRLAAEGHADISVGLLIHVGDPDEPLVLSEDDARFLTAVQAVELSIQSDRAASLQTEMAMG